MVDTDTSTLDAAVTLAYQESSYFAQRPQLQHDQLATVKATKQTHRGSSVNFTFYVDPADATTPLNEGQEATPVALTDSVVNVALDEYGLVINRTLKLTALGFLQYDADIANIVGYSGGST
ncbi:MAG: hypothetical protein GY697_25015, partial [Desulfobacterales bacterium]|nr:hypothetical protein [Desulfobacterales bacterium]